MNNNKFIQAIEDSIKFSIQKDLSNKITENEEYKKKINDLKLDMYLRYFSSFTR